MNGERQDMSCYLERNSSEKRTRWEFPHTTLAMLQTYSDRKMREVSKCKTSNKSKDNKKKWLTVQGHTLRFTMCGKKKTKKQTQSKIKKSNLWFKLKVVSPEGLCPSLFKSLFSSASTDLQLSTYITAQHNFFFCVLDWILILKYLYGLLGGPYCGNSEVAVEMLVEWEEPFKERGPGDTLLGE